MFTLCVFSCLCVGVSGCVVLVHDCAPFQPQRSPPCRRTVYLDHAGATLYSAQQVRQHADFLCAGMLGNPHSQSRVCKRTQQLVEETRHRVSSFLVGTECSSEYRLIFTSGATAALKLVGECFAWTPFSRFMHLQMLHNSALGIREFCAHPQFSPPPPW